MIVGQPAELLGGQVAARDEHLDGDEALLALGAHVGARERLELASVAVGRGDLYRRGGRVGLLVVLEEQAVERVVALGRPSRP